MSKIKIDMLSAATSVDGQGVGSAYIEQVALIKDASDLFEVSINTDGKHDIYHHHTVNPRFYLAYNKKGIHVTYVHFLPDTLDGSLKLPKLFGRWFRWYTIKYYKKADEIVVVNPIFIDELVKLGIKRDKITYIPNYVSHDKFYKLTDEEILEAKKEYGIPTDKFISLGVGQVQTRKGVLDFVDVASKNPDKFFVWAGGFSFGPITDGYHDLKKIIDNPPANIKFLGIVPRSDMNKIYNICDCLFMPSYNELFPMAILEAVNTAKPLVLRNLKLYEDILFHKYIEASDNDAFSNAIDKLASNKEYFASEQENSMYLSNYYSKSHVQSIWIDYYKSLLEKYKNTNKVFKHKEK